MSCFTFPETIIGVISVENCADGCKSMLKFHSVQSIGLSCRLQIKKRGFIVIIGHGNSLNYRPLAVFGG